MFPWPCGASTSSAGLRISPRIRSGILLATSYWLPRGCFFLFTPGEKREEEEKKKKKKAEKVNQREKERGKRRGKKKVCCREREREREEKK
jgi:hypothetical protein